jgi:hypothetical protein
MSEQYPNPKTPQWAQPQQPTHTGWVTPPLAPRPPKKHTGWKIAGGVVGAIVVISVISAVAGGGKGDDDKTAVTAPTSAAATTQQDAAPAAEPTTKVAAAPAPRTTAPKPKPKPKPKTVLSESGHGIKTTKRFTVHGDWDLHYTYSCTSFGMKGNFIITTGGTDFPMPLANELGMKGTETTHQHDGGTLYLDVNSECSWTIKVIDIP